MSMFWKVIAAKNDQTKSKADQYRAFIENIESSDLRVMLQNYPKTAEFAKVILEVLTKR